MSRVLDEIRTGLEQATARRGEPRPASQPAAMASLTPYLGAAARHAIDGVRHANQPSLRTPAFLAEREQLLELAVETIRAVESLDANELALHHREAARA